MAGFPGNIFANASVKAMTVPGSLIGGTGTQRDTITQAKSHPAFDRVASKTRAVTSGVWRR